MQDYTKILLNNKWNEGDYLIDATLKKKCDDNKSIVTEQIDESNAKAKIAIQQSNDENLKVLNSNSKEITLEKKCNPAKTIVFAPIAIFVNSISLRQISR